MPAYICLSPQLTGDNARFYVGDEDLVFPCDLVPVPGSTRGQMYLNPISIIGRSYLEIRQHLTKMGPGMVMDVNKKIIDPDTFDILDYFSEDQLQEIQEQKELQRQKDTPNL